MNGLSKKLWKQFDIITLLLVTALVFVGFALIAYTNTKPFSGQETGMSEIIAQIDFQYVWLQIMWFVVGLALIFVICLIDYHVYADLIKIPYVILCIALVVLLILGNTKKGTAGWYGIGERGFQPSEFMKIVLIIGLARYIAKELETHERVGIGMTFLKMTIFIAIPFVLVAIQPDLGTALTYIVIWMLMLFVAKFPIRWFILVIIVGIIASIMLFPRLDAYQQARIFNQYPALEENTWFLNMMRITPERLTEIKTYYDRHQIDAALQVISNGGMRGRDFTDPGNLIQLEILPEDHTDFIFASGIEWIGVMGGIGIIVLYSLLLARMAYLAINARDTLGRFIIIGVIGMEVYHIVENIGMNIGILPITGIPLPFISYGGSNMLTNMIAVAIVLNVGMRRPVKK